MIRRGTCAERNACCLAYRSAETDAELSPGISLRDDHRVWTRGISIIIRSVAVLYIPFPMPQRNDSHVETRPTIVVFVPGQVPACFSLYLPIRGRVYLYCLCYDSHRVRHHTW